MSVDETKESLLRNPDWKIWFEENYIPKDYKVVDCETHIVIIGAEHYTYLKNKKNGRIREFIKVYR